MGACIRQTVSAPWLFPYATYTGQVVCCRHTGICIHRVLPQVSLWANSNCTRCSRKQGTKEIYNPVSNYNTVIKLLLCANKHSCLVLIIHEILTMVKTLFEEKCKHNGENHEEEEGKEGIIKYWKITRVRKKLGACVEGNMQLSESEVEIRH